MGFVKLTLEAGLTRKVEATLVKKDEITKIETWTFTTSPSVTHYYEIVFHDGQWRMAPEVRGSKTTVGGVWAGFVDDGTGWLTCPECGGDCPSNWTMEDSPPRGHLQHCSHVREAMKPGSVFVEWGRKLCVARNRAAWNANVRPRS